MDLTIFNLIHNLSGKIRLFDLFAIFLADYFGYFLALAALYVIFSGTKDWRIKSHNFLFLILSLILARGFIAETIYFFYNRVRPFAVLDFTPLVNHESLFSFPSGHATFYFTIALAALYLNRKWGTRILIGAFILSLARVFAGVHWPSDVLGGLVVAFIGVFAARKILGAPDFKEDANEVK